MKLNQRNIHEILSLLGEHLAQASSELIRLIVCGGTALNVLGLVVRTTKDVDVIGGLDEQGRWIKDLPEEFWKGVKEVGAFYQLPKDWLNFGPQSYLETGLPNGLISRVTWKTYSPVFELGYISRFDQIHLKLYASADRAGYHVDDLLQLQPNSEEIVLASKWCLGQDVYEEFREILISMLIQLGFKNEAAIL